MPIVSYKPFDAALRTRFSGLIDEASAQDELLLHSPGTVIYTTKAGQEYAYWRYYVPDGKQRDEYIGPAGDTETRTTITEIQARIADAKSLMEGSRLLRQAGFAAADNSTSITLATLFNVGLFREGAMLVGTHAFGALLNTLGIRPNVSYYTEDVDIARYAQIKVALAPEERFVDLLRKSGLNFTPIPPLDHHRPPSSFRARGKKLSVDLLVPGDKEYRAYPVPELHTHATGLPFLRYLLEDNTTTAILGRDHVVPVRVPVPARYCLHKLIVADMRVSTNTAKKEKDLSQAALLAAVLTDTFPGALEDAAKMLPKGAVRHITRSAKSALKLLDDQSEAHDFLQILSKR